MKIVQISLLERDGVARSAEPIAIGIPFAESVVPAAELLQLRYENGDAIAADTCVTARWPDGSVRWCLFRFLVRVPPHSESRIDIIKMSQAKKVPVSPLIVAEEPDLYSAKTGKIIFSGSPQSHLWRVNLGSDAHEPRFEVSSITLEGASGPACTASIEHTELVVGNAKVSVRVTQSGSFQTGTGQTFCRFTSTIELFVDSSLVRWRFNLHNPRAAQHHSGLWDLGDSGSIFIKQLALKLELPQKNEFRCQVQANDEWMPPTVSANLFQASSGGEHWNSSNHVNSCNEVRLPFRGFQYRDDIGQLRGLRASPIFFSNTGCSAYIDKFWQNFPKAISADTGALTLHLFPEQFVDGFELQGGEMKTHTVYLEFSNDPNALAWARSPLIVHLPPEYLAATRCLLYFGTKREAIDDLIGTGLEVENGFLAKRERIDEYGWRHFGDVFADHESLYLPPGDVFVSHYNNQYDTLYGYIRQYLISGRTTWWELAQDLAQHLVDIDVYNTVVDRAEYNGGLFWHTDHYVDAYTATHRTYSRLQKPNGIQVTAGGGPGPEHCYAHGLLLHYFLTGSEQTKTAVLSLAHWMIRIYEGSDTFTEQLVHIKNHVLPKIRNANSHQGILRHTLPMNRGVGNYINALLDAFALTDQIHYLAKVEAIVQRAVHPYDTIADRSFDDIELTWHYTVFLQAVIRYLELKKSRREFDYVFHYSLQSVLHYSAWMAEHETPYLEHPERLEYPNDTWTAQDIRKAHILYFASRHHGDAKTRERCKARADYFYSYTSDRLTQSQTRHFTRIIGILMQNHGPRTFYTEMATSTAIPSSTDNPSAQLDYGSPYVSRSGLALHALSGLMRALLHFSLKNELSWLRFRSRLIMKIYQHLYE